MFGSRYRKPSRTKIPLDADNIIEPKKGRNLNYKVIKSSLGTHPTEVELFPVELRAVLNKDNKRREDLYLSDQTESDCHNTYHEHHCKIPRRQRSPSSIIWNTEHRCSTTPDVYRNILGPTPDESILAGLQTVIDICGLVDCCHSDSEERIPYETIFESYALAQTQKETPKKSRSRSLDNTSFLDETYVTAISDPPAHSTPIGSRSNSFRPDASELNQPQGDFVDSPSTRRYSPPSIKDEFYTPSSSKNITYRSKEGIEYSPSPSRQKSPYRIKEETEYPSTSPKPRSSSRLIDIYSPSSSPSRQKSPMHIKEEAAYSPSLSRQKSPRDIKEEMMYTPSLSRQQSPQRVKEEVTYSPSPARQKSPQRIKEEITYSPSPYRQKSPQHIKQEFIFSPSPSGQNYSQHIKEEDLYSPSPPREGSPLQLKDEPYSPPSFRRPVFDNEEVTTSPSGMDSTPYLATSETDGTMYESKTWCKMDECCGTVGDSLPCIRIKAKDGRDVCIKYKCKTIQSSLSAKCFPPVEIPPCNLGCKKCVIVSKGVTASDLDLTQSSAKPKKKTSKTKQDTEARQVVVQDPRACASLNLDFKYPLDPKYTCNPAYPAPIEKPTKDFTKFTRTAIPPVQPVIGVCSGTCGESGGGTVDPNCPERTLEVRYALVRISVFPNYTTYEIMKSSNKKPKKLPENVEGIFVTKR